MLLAATNMQGCYADDLSLLGDAKKSDEKRQRNRRRLKKSTKSTKSDLVNSTPDEDNGEVVQVGKDIPRTEDDIWKVNMVLMSDDGLRFADSNNVYQYDESSQSWESRSPDSLAGYSILGMSSDGQDVLVGKLSDSFMSLELRTFDEVGDVWKFAGGGNVSYTPLKALLGGDIITENYAKLSHNGRRMIVTDGSGIRVFEISSSPIWVQIGETIASGVSREIAINDDGSQICFSTDYVDDKYGPGAVVSVYRLLVTDRSGGSWKQIGGYLADGGYYGWYGINYDMNSSGNRIIVGYSDGSGRYYSGDAKVFEYSEEIYEWKQVANDLGGGTHVKMSADGKTVAVGRHQDFEYLWSGPDGTCCNTYVKIYNIWEGDGELYWEKVATITSGPRYYSVMRSLRQPHFIVLL
ncbi:hypothetical protein CTEN210_18319 [Chaetoceros tenuissimus]|uniref:Uncharacterized protein n=1 Tax=Chaetoceros tenuissimus TaxID=426638 RepID=A0AAD3DCF3_9STRA|nr:hypothetical protein CTEN210_18319 [Chaetoceros tenuissimus]